MTKKIFCCVLLFSLAISVVLSCKKKKEPKPNEPEVTYIKGEIDNTPFYYDADKSLNELYKQEKYDLIYLLKDDNEGRRLQITLLVFPRLDSVACPLDFPLQNKPQSLGIYWSDYSKYRDSSLISKSDYSSHIGSVKLTLLSKLSDLLTGNFSGDVINLYGDTMRITKGEFRIKIKR